MEPSNPSYRLENKSVNIPVNNERTYCIHNRKKERKKERTKERNKERKKERKIVCWLS